MSVVCEQLATDLVPSLLPAVAVFALTSIAAAGSSQNHVGKAG